MSIGSDFRADAQELIKFFAQENGTSTYSHKTGQSYDTTLGTNTNTYSDQEYYIAFDEIRDGVTLEGTPLTSEYLKNHMQALIAGADLIEDVGVGDLVEYQGNSYKVVYWVADMYEALYTIHIPRKPENV